MYGVIPNQGIADQNIALVRILMERYMRASDAHRPWAEEAKVCQDFFEGRQWTEQQKAALAKTKRAPIVLNKIASLIRLVSGYQRNNRTDIRFMPLNDASSSENIADVLSMLMKSEAERNKLQFKDSDVFLDGIITGRGIWDWRLDFEDNDFGELKVTQDDPFSVFIDPDHDQYDLNKAGYITESRWVSLDEVEFSYGRGVMEAIRNRVGYGGQSLSQSIHNPVYEEISPIRKFGQYEDDDNTGISRDLYYHEFVDTFRKQIRLTDTQYAVTTWQKHFIDLETGDRSPIPEDWDQARIDKCLYYAQARNNQMIVDWRKNRRIRWTVMCGDIIVHDKWSPYKGYTKIGFFPYFRRGITRGLISDLLDPQREINKKRSSILDITSRNSNSGWKYHENSLDPEQEEHLKNYGAMPGVNLKWKGDAAGQPQRIEAGQFPAALATLEEKSRGDLLEIAGINESALGELDQVQSGRAIEARQKQTVISLQLYLDNMSRSKGLQGDKGLEIFQNHYTEARLFRTLGEDGRLVSMEINKKQMGMEGQTIMARLNDITLGRYSVKVDEIPMASTFQSAQFEEAMSILEKLGPVGMALLQIKPDLLIQMSTLPRKEEWAAAIQQAMGTTAAQGSPGGAPGSSPPGAPPTNLGGQEAAPPPQG